MRRLFLIGVAWVVLTSTAIAAEPAYDAGKLHDLADQIESEAKMNIDKSAYPAQVFQIMGYAQMNFSRILMKQHDELIRQNDEIIRKNDEIIRLLRKIPKQ